LVNDENIDWKFIPDCNQNYAVSNTGVVLSYKTNVLNPKVLKPFLSGDYYAVTLIVKDRKKNIRIHQLVAQMFLPQPSQKHKYIIHKDWDKANNCSSNLEWVEKHVVRNRLSDLYLQKTTQERESLKCSKLTSRDVAAIKGLINAGVKQESIARLFLVSEMQISRIKRGISWPDVVAAAY